MCEKFKMTRLLICFFAALLAVSAVAYGLPQNIASSLAQEGWTQEEPGLWTRETADGRTQTQAFGADGLQAMARRLENRIETFEALYRKQPDSELERLIEEHLMRIDRLERQARNATKGLHGQDDPKPAPWCFLDWEAGLSSTCDSQGAQAEATYNGSSAEDCFGDCKVVSFAYVRRTDCDGNLNVDANGICHDQGINISCTSSASLSGSTDGADCFSYADAAISCDTFYREEIRRSDECCCVSC